MTAYPTESPAVQPARPVFVDVLPGATPAAVRWTPGRRAGTGLLCVQARRRPCEYLVVELPTGWDGRAVRMAKVAGSPGSDAEAESYDVYVGRNGQDRRCHCRGFLRWGHCKHVEALAALLANGWLDLEGEDPGADVGGTEPPADQPEPAWAAA